MFITLTDIFGNEVQSKRLDNNTIDKNNILILVSSNQIYSFMKKISKLKDDSIWEVTHIDQIFKNNNLNFDDYVSFGNIYVSGKITPKSLIFGKVDNDIICPAINYEFVKSYGKGSLWKPVAQNGYSSIGLVFSSSENKPTSRTGVIKNKYVINYKDDNQINHDSNLINANEFNLIANGGTDRLTVWRSKFYKGNDKLKLLSYDGKYMTGSNGSFAMKGAQPYFQDLQYTIQGDLLLGNNCVSANQDNIYLDTCNGAIEQKWYPYKKSIASQKNNKCISDVHDPDTLSNKLELTECDQINDLNEILIQATGKQVMLVESNNPWYVNVSADQVPAQYKKIDFEEIDINGLEYRNQAEFQSTMKLDPNRNDLGLGYSFISRKGVPCNIENFDSTDQISILSIIIILIVILVIKSFNN